MLRIISSVLPTREQLTQVVGSQDHPICELQAQHGSTGNEGLSEAA